MYKALSAVSDTYKELCKCKQQLVKTSQEVKGVGREGR
jgi:hypothetical protein